MWNDGMVSGIWQLFADGGVRVKFIFGGCGGRALREPPKITPRRGEALGTWLGELRDSESRIT